MTSLRSRKQTKDDVSPKTKNKRELSNAPDTNDNRNPEVTMSSAINWGADELAPSIGGEASTLVREAALEHRLKALRDVALHLLTEVESLGGTKPRGYRNLRLHEEVQQFEIDLIRIALDRTGGSQTQAARMLGVKLTTLNTKIKKYGIECPGQRTDHNPGEPDS